MMSTLYAVGAGPGDPQLITLRGLRAIHAADIVFLPSTRAGGSYAQSIVDEYLNQDRQAIVELVCPAYRDRPAIKARWIELAGLVCERLGENRTGAFVCEGDPSLYSTWIHLRAGLAQIGAGVALHTVPGVSSISAAAAAAGFPLAVGNQRLLITPEPINAAALSGLLQHSETLALLKQGGDLAAVADAIDSFGPAIRAAMVRRAGRPDQLIADDSAAMRASGADYFTTVLVTRCDR
jgi:precorrin-2/cobalt-factor-2 C20-methyltransferase